MTNRNYISGRNFEYKVRDHFRGIGFFVIRSAGSKSPIDLVAIPRIDLVTGLGAHDVLLIQCKHNTSPFPKPSKIKKILNQVDFRFIVAYDDKIRGRPILFEEYIVRCGKVYSHEVTF